MSSPVPLPLEGRLAIVTDVGSGMRWACWRARRARPMRTAKSCGPDLPTLGSSSARHIVERWWLKSPVHQGEHVYAVKPLRRECRRFGVPVVTCLRAFFHCTQGCGCVRCTGIPCALLLSRGRDRCITRARFVPRECGVTSPPMSCPAKAGHPAFQRPQT